MQGHFRHLTDTEWLPETHRIRAPNLPYVGGGEALIYFVQSRDNGFIKIGQTSNLRRRLDSLAGSSPSPLALVGLIGAHELLEAALHSFFQDYRSHGEWFSPGAGLVRFLKSAKAREKRVRNFSDDLNYREDGDGGHYTALLDYLTTRFSDCKP